MTDKNRKYQRTTHLLRHSFIHCNIHENCCNIRAAALAITFCSICSFILTAIVHLLIQVAILDPTHGIVNILIIGNKNK